MPNIHVLDQSTINQIAAGEVIERPASVVKELLENAIDAKATAVTVEIRDGGISLIRVTDNGCGIPREELPLAFLRHSTSKIQSVEDLFTVSSLGFRGEALSSIAAVSQVEVITKTHDSLSGTRYQIEGGEEKSIEDIGAPEGTTFLARNLFYNTPVRRKFLKTPATEGSHVADLVEKIALSHPEISIRFIQNNQNRLHTSGNHSLKDIIYTVFGREIAGNLLPVESRHEMVSVSGFIGKPVIARNNRNYEQYFINGRYIKSGILYKAIEEAYKPFMMQHKYPFTLLHLTIEPEYLDVNVHPTKMELRFRDGEQIFLRVRDAIGEVLRQNELIPQVELTKEQSRETERVRRAVQEKRIPVPEPAPRQTGAGDRRLGQAPSSLEYGLPFGAGRDGGKAGAWERSAKTPLTDPILRDGAAGYGSAAGRGAQKAVQGMQETGQPAQPGVSGTQAAGHPAQTGVPGTQETSRPAQTPARGISAGMDLGSLGKNGGGKSTIQVDEVLTALLVGDPIPPGAGPDPAAGDAAFGQQPLPAAVQTPSEAQTGDARSEAGEPAPDGRQLELFAGEKLLDARSRSRHKLIGQLFDTYWLVEFGQNLYIIDQHAAHEKVLYEKTMAALKTRQYTCQMVDPPIILTLGSREEVMLKEHLPYFTDIGFEIEPFGGREYAVRGVPDNLFSIAKKDLLLEMLDGLAEDTLTGGSEMIYEKVASMSCKAAVKGNHQMSAAEADRLIDELLGLENPYACPHGRPTIVSMSKYELEKKFKRIV